MGRSRSRQRALGVTREYSLYVLECLFPVVIDLVREVEEGKLD